MKLAPEKDCTACMACVDACAHGVIGCKTDNDGYFKIYVNNPQKCTNCGLCSKVCPVLTPPRRNDGEESRPFAAWADDDESRMHGASGGVFGSLARTVVAQGGVVYGAAIDGFEVLHKRVDTLEGIASLQGSKYQHSSMKGIYRQVRKDLAQGRRVLFCGLSCQIGGLYSFLAPANTDNLFTLDTICGGLSTMLPMLWLKESGRYNGIVSFRDKEQGWRPTGFRYALKMQSTSGETVDLGLDNPVLNTFSSKLLKRSSCLKCRFNGCNRLSDATIGDFWRATGFQAQYPKGLSEIIFHNKRLQTLLDESTLQTAEVKWSDVIPGNHNINWTDYPLIRHLPMRRKALDAMRKGDFAKSQKYISPHTLPGMVLRIYLKINELRRKLRLAANRQ